MVRHGVEQRFALTSARRPNGRFFYARAIRPLLKILVAAGAAVLAVASPAWAASDRASLVDPFVGTAADTGNTFPGAVFPHGLVQFSPVSAHSESPGGYSYEDTTLRGFALTRLSGAGCTNSGDLPILPLAQAPTRFGSAPEDIPFATFRHAVERASPGAYRVQLDDGIGVGLTATPRTGEATFTFPGGGQYVALDAGGGGRPRHAISVRVVDDHKVQGSITEDGFCGGPASPTLYFDLRFDHPVTSVRSWGEDGVVQEGVAQRDAVARGGLVLGFGSAVVRLKVGVSYVSIANAGLNLATEAPGWSFDRIARDAHAAWNRVLARVDVTGGSLAKRRTFYTALYHAFIHPTIASDVNGQFRRRDGRVGRAVGYTRLTNISGWDVYRTQIPLLALLEPKVADDLARSMLAGGVESGTLAKWEYAGVETGTMVGDPAAPIIADVLAFGDGRIDLRAALAALVRAGTQVVAGALMYPSHLVPTDGSAFGAYVERPALADYENLGYVPYDLREGPVWGTAATTLEYAVADFAVSRLALAAGSGATAVRFLERSGAWRNLYNPLAGYLEPRNADGSFLPSYSLVSKIGFVEGNSMQYTWSVPQDMGGLIGAIGKTSAQARLDALLKKLNTDRYSPYAWLGNEPSFELPWIYLWMGKPSKTQAAVQRATTTLFHPTPGGLPGDDDLGALSAWYVWSSLGLYPAIPGVGGFAVGSPTFASATIHRLGGAVSISARGGPGKYVRGFTVDGRTAVRPWVELPRRGTIADLRFTLAARPSAWAVRKAPPSFATR